MKKILLISVLFFVLIAGLTAKNVDTRLGFSWAFTHIADPNPSNTAYSEGDADINGFGISVGTAVENYNNTAFWAELSFIFPGSFKFDGTAIPVPSNSYLFFTDLAAGAAFTFDLKNLELYLGLGYSVCDLYYRYNLSNTRYREYTLSTSGPAAYVAAKLDLAKSMSLQLTAVPKLSFFTSRVTRDKGNSYGRDTIRDFQFRTSFEVNASLSFVYTF